jgi:hypothetical protein
VVDVGTSITAELAALCATVIATCGAAPQVRKLIRTRDIAGLSVSCAMLGIGTEVAWCAYAAQGRLWMVLPEACLMLVANAVLATMLVRLGSTCRRAAMAAATWAAAIATVFVAGGAGALAGLLGFGYTVQAVPSVWTAYRTHVPSGIAPLRWWLLGAEGLLWGVYAVQHRDPAIISFACVSVCAATAIVLRTRTTRLRLAI